MSNIQPAGFPDFLDKDFSEVGDDKKIALLGNRIEWLSKEEIIRSKAEELPLSRVAELAGQINFAEINRSIPALKNLKWIYHKIKNEKETIEEDRFKAIIEILTAKIEKIEIIAGHISPRILNKISAFIEQNREAMTAGSLGVDSKSRKGFKKIKAKKFDKDSTLDIPFNLEYDVQNGDLFVKLGFLGEGEFKKVTKKLHLRDFDSYPKMFGVEMDAIAKQEKGKVSDQEVRMMKIAQGLPHVVQLKEVSEYTSKRHRTKSTMVLTLCNMGELSKCLKMGNLTELDKLQIASDTIKGVMELHSRGILHRDIKPLNIFLEKKFRDGQEVVHAFVGDLGVACLKEGDETRKEKKGTLPYLPPEIVDNSSIADFDSDAWSVGITFYEIFRGEYPFGIILADSDIIKCSNFLRDAQKNPKPADENSVDYVIWGFMQPDRTLRMTLPHALAIIENQLEEAKTKLV